MLALIKNTIPVCAVCFKRELHKSFKDEHFFFLKKAVSLKKLSLISPPLPFFSSSSYMNLCTSSTPLTIT